MLFYDRNKHKRIILFIKEAIIDNTYLEFEKIEVALPMGNSYSS
jgi:hypothetical protein